MLFILKLKQFFYIYLNIYLIQNLLFLKGFTIKVKYRILYIS